MNDKQFLTWIYERLITIHGENPRADYMHRLKSLGENYKRSEFLPEGWQWVHTKRCWEVHNLTERVCSFRLHKEDSKAIWYVYNLLSPEENGGFEKHIPGDNPPFSKGHCHCQLRNGRIIAICVENILWSASTTQPDRDIVGWRPI